MSDINLQRVVITGATGFVGANLAITLLQSAEALLGFPVHVRCTKRASSKTDHLQDYPQIEWVDADLEDCAALTAAFLGADVVFHCAALVETLRVVTPKMHAANIAGTANVLEAVRLAKVKRLIHCSSTVAVAVASSPSKPSTEDDTWNFEQWGLADGYTVSKHLAEVAISEALEKYAQLDVVVVNPAFMIGPRDPHVSSNMLLLELVQGRIPAVPAGRNNFVDVRDVTRGMLLAWKRGVRGRRYIMGGHNLLYGEFFSLACRVLNCPRQCPKWHVPYAFASMLGWMGEMAQMVVRKELNVNVSRVRYAYCPNFVFSSQRAIEELGYTISPLDNAVLDSFEWLQSRGKLPS